MTDRIYYLVSPTGFRQDEVLYQAGRNEEEAAERVAGDYKDEPDNLNAYVHRVPADHAKVRGAHRDSGFPGVDPIPHISELTAPVADDPDLIGADF